MSENVFTLFLTENIAREQYQNRTLYIYIHVIALCVAIFGDLENKLQHGSDL